ncbi:MAG: phosphate acetyltransferase [Naasia sp.]
METRNVYITSVEGETGKSTVALGILDALSHEIDRVGVFRPVARSTSERDYVLELLLDHDGVDLAYEDCVGVSYDEVHANPEAALSRIVERYKAVEAQCSAVVILGSDYTDVGTPTELSFNARVAANLGAPVVLVLGGRVSGQGELGSARARTADELAQVAEVAVGELRNEHAAVLAVIANRVDPAITQAVRFTVGLTLNDENVPVWAIPEDQLLVAPTLQNLTSAVSGTLIQGDTAMLQRSVFGVVVAGMSMVNVLPRLTEGAVVVVPSDRVEVLVAALLAQASGTFPSLAGIILNGGFELPEQIERLIAGVDVSLPIISTNLGTYETTLRVTRARGKLAAESPAKYEQALALFERSVDRRALIDLLEVRRATVTTPLMFEHQLLEQARSAGSHIVLPEGSDDRILLAADRLLRRDVARLTILGDEGEVRSRASALGVDLTRAQVVNPQTSELRQQFAEEYTRLRAHKGMTVDIALNVVADVSYFGTMMVHLGLADGMVSGAAHTTAHTIRPSFEIIKTKPGVSVVSSVFLMALADRVLVYGDCAVIPDPTSDQLADIAVSSATTATAFGIDPRIAMLSYSTGESGEGADVEKVRAATELVRQRRPDLLVEGPIQYDAAADAAVAAAKLPESEVAGRATVYIFPDLNTGNNTYKAVQRSAGAVAIGPVLQGLNKPVNDLSRGALVQDIVNTVAITAIQAGQALAAASAAAGTEAR